MKFDTDDASARSDNFRLINRKRLENLSQLTRTPTRTLFQWWQSYAPKNPSREDFDITKLPSLASHIYLIEVTAPGKYLYRLCGQRAGFLIGKTHRMTPISAESESLEDRKLVDYLDTLFNEGTCCYCTGDLSFFEGNIVKFESVDCPLRNAAGDVTHFVGVLCEVSN
ncbi:MAG: PAS domain-containing protein [Pseudomonas marincola]